MYGVITTIPAPVETYDAVHAEWLKRVGATVDGLLVHIGRGTTDGFQTLEVCESKEHDDRAVSASWRAIAERTAALYGSLVG